MERNPSNSNPDEGEQASPETHKGLSMVISPDGKKMHIDPRDISLGSIKLFLIHQIYTTKRVRITYEAEGLIDEITPQQLVDARMHWTDEDREHFIDEKAQDLGFAERITIEHLDNGS